ncbi:MAG: hypothetical protein JRI68_12505 [Deltaproteobacteria bacterium]|nr:hypothetical protein [Deltaproteobacteria bacterium]
MSPARACRQRLVRPAWPILALLLSMLAGCPRDPGGSTTARGPLDPGAARSVAQIDVRHLDQRPRLTLIARDGDPTPALVVAVLAQAGPIWHTALAALLEERLRAAGYSVETRADALGLRLHYAPADAESVAAFLVALAKATGKPVAPTSEALPRVRARLAALHRRPLDGPPQAAVSACGGQLGIVATEPLPALTTATEVASLDAARREALVQERTSIAVVGPLALTGTVVASLEASEGWLHGTGATAQWPSDDQHGAYLSAELPQPGSARLDVALRTPDALAAVGAAKRASRPGSPLTLKLAATAPAWRLVELSAAAHSHGGCVTARLSADGPLAVGAAPAAGRTGSTAPETAARVVALVAAELERSAAEPTDPFEVTAEIIGAVDPGDAAARAAWWAITGKPAVQSDPAVASAFATSAHGKEPLPLSATDLDARYRTAVAQQPNREGTGPIAERRLAVERGQGELWLLVASPCAPALEGSWDTGRSALAALAAAASADGQLDVSIEPWVTADGIGLIAHSGLARAEESPEALARRVATAAGRALLAQTADDPTFDQAKATLLAMLERDGAAGYAGFAARAVPQHPGWIAPWGATDRQLGVTAQDVRERWRQVQGAPLRVAVLANADQAQAELAASRLDRWLLGDAKARACAEDPKPGPARPGQHSIAPSSASLGQLVVGATLLANTHDDARLAHQLVAALAGQDGLLRRRLPDLPVVSARLLGGTRARAVVVEVRAPRSQLGAARQRVTKLLAGLATGGLDGPDRRRGHERARADQRAQHRHPTTRLAALWRGEPPPSETATEPTEAQWRAWLSRTLRADRLIVVTEEPGGP